LPSSGLSDLRHGRLSKHLPIPARVAATLGEWLEQYILTRHGLSDGGLRKLTQTRRKLEEYFGKDCRLRDITPERASEWQSHLGSHLREATVKTHGGNAKAIFAEAVRRKLLAESPVSHLRSGSTPREDFEVVPASDVLAVMDKLKDRPELQLR